ncbi:MAG: hypothetical protein HY512_00475 [Candidatus Aenigmarchaeota archaeon]|nr:hypothetical protein [Candidatus Aenigmarchaeota archaeon]
MEKDILDTFRRYCVDYNPESDVRSYKVGHTPMSPRQIYESVKRGEDAQDFELGDAFFRCAGDSIVQSFNDIPRIALDPRPFIGEKNAYRMARRIGKGVATSLASTAFIRTATYAGYASLATGAYVVLRHLFN